MQQEEKQQPHWDRYLEEEFELNWGGMKEPLKALKRGRSLIWTLESQLGFMVSNTYMGLVTHKITFYSGYQAGGMLAHEKVPRD